MKLSLQLAVADLLTTEAFYGGILGLPVRRSLTVRGAPEHLIVRNEDWELVFVDEKAVLREHPALDERFSLFPKGVGITLHFHVADIEDIYDAVMEEELQIFYPLERKPYGVKQFWCFDPDGYLVAVEESLR